MEDLHGQESDMREVATASTQSPKRHRPVAWMVLTLVLMLVAAAFAYLFFTTQQQLTKKDAQLTSANAQVSSLREGQAAKKNTDDSAASSQSTDADKIVALLTADMRARVGNENTKVSVSVTNKQLPFARANVSVGEGGGYACVLKKADDIWLKLYCGQQPAPETDSVVQLYGVPAAIR